MLFIWNRTASQTVSVSVPDVASSIEFDVGGRPLDWDENAGALSRVALTKGVPRIFRLLTAPSR